MKHMISKKKKRTISLTALLTTLSIVIFLLCFLMVEQSNRMIHKETNRYLSEISQQSAYKVNQRINYNLNTIQAIAETLSLLQNEPQELRDEYIEKMISSYSFLWIGYASPDGTLQIGGMPDQNIASFPAIQDALQGEPGVSPYLVSASDGARGIVFTVPYVLNGEKQGAIAGWSSMKNVKYLLSSETFGGQGFAHIIDANGDFILSSDNPNAILGDGNFFDTIKDRTAITDESLNLMKTEISNGETGHMHIRIDDSIEEDMNYTPLSAKGWYLISVAPSGVYTDTINSFTKSAIALTIAIFLIFTALIILIVRLDSKKNAEIARAAYEDPITGGFTSARLEIALADRLKNFKPFSFVSLDIRKFKLINDSFGSTDGNQVLHYIHAVIQRHLSEGECVSRVSADVFDLMLFTTSSGEIQQRIQDISKDLNSFNDRAEAPYYLPIDCGVYIVTEPETDIITIRDRSNTARKINKKSRLNTQHLISCMFYSDLERQLLLHEKDMENNMERALENEEFVVYFQPKINLVTNAVAGAEALVRWQPPGKALIPPNDFIPFFEKNGFILKLDLYVFEKVCKVIKGWIDQGLDPVPISVNLSRIHLRVPNFLDEFKTIQEKYKIPPQLLEIELTETMVFENLEFLKQVVQQIHDLGFQCSMDDFGSGYSSLNVLKDVPVDILKLDKVFFDSGSNERGNDVIESVIQLAKKLGMITISEGVETLPQVEFLKQVNCDIVQGYVFSRPIPIEDFEKMVYF